MSNWFEENAKKIGIVFYSLLAVGLCVGGFFGVKAVKDDINRGYERNIDLRERKPMSDRMITPDRSQLAYADTLEKRPYRVRVDENGFIMPAKIYEESDLEVLFFGGSTTECLFMEEDERFPYRFGRELEKRTGRKVNSYNGGKAGNDSLHSTFSLLAKGVPMHPDVVVLMHNINDYTSLLIAKSHWKPGHPRDFIELRKYGNYKKWLVRNFMNAKILDQGADEWAKYRGQNMTLDISFVTKEFKKVLETFVFICRQYDAQPILMTQFNRLTDNPDDCVKAQMAQFTKDYGLPYEDFLRGYRAMNDTIRQVAREQNVPLVDLAIEVPQTNEYMHDLVHLTPKGSVFVADHLADWFIQEPRLKPLAQ